MNEFKNNAVARARAPRTGVERLLWASAGVAALILAYVWLASPSPRERDPSVRVTPQPTVPQAAVPGPEATTSVVGKPALQDDAGKLSKADSLPLPKPQAPPVDDARDVLRDLLQVASGKRASKQEQARKIDRALRRLIALGDDAVPAIEAFLAEGEDVRFDFFTPDGEGLTHGSLRLGLFHALGRIGGPAAVAVLYGEFQATTVPAELEALARHLEEQAPGEYRQEVVRAAGETLALAPDPVTASAAGLGGTDVGKLFELLRAHGDRDAVPQLEKAMEDWWVYASVALAGLPDGAGVPSLIGMVERREQTGANQDIGQDPGLMALQMLAQVAAEDGAAQATLLEQAQTARVPSEMWPRIASGLAGNGQMQLARPQGSPGGRGGTSGAIAGGLAWHIATFARQTVYIRHTAAKLSSAEARARVAFIDQMLSSTADPAAIDALTEARALLAGRR